MMPLQNPDLKKSSQSNDHRFHLSPIVRWLLVGGVFMVMFYLFVSPTSLFGQSQLLTQEIRFYKPEAGEVFFVWGIDGWAVAPAAQQPAGTVVKNGVMRTPMVREGDTFRVEVQVPAGTTLDYGFLITQLSDNTVVNIWEADGDQDYHTVVTQDDVIEVVTPSPLESLVTQEFRYMMPEAGEVTLVWGVNGWNVVSEKIVLSGTVIEADLMRTSMVREGDAFIAKIQVPSGSAIDYGFLITKKQGGMTIKPVWDGDQPQPVVAMEDNLIELKTTASLALARRLLSPFELWFRLAAGAVLVCGVIIVLTNVTRNSQPQAVIWLLVGLTLWGFILRAYAAWDLNTYVPDGAGRLVGDEPGYDGLARGLLYDFNYTWPGRVPLYPLWLAGVYWLTGGNYLAVPYFQALLGISVIPLTYLLGRRVFGPTAGLIATFFAAISYGLIGQSLHLLSEVLYTPILLLVAITLWDALHKPTLWRFGWAGVLLGLSSLVRPTLLFFPIAIVILFIILLDKRRAIRYWVVYLVAALLLIAPWIWHNYLTHQAIFPLQTSNAILWQGSPEYYHLIYDEGYTYTQIWGEILHGPAWDAPSPLTIEGDRWWTQRAIRSIAAEPGIYVWFALEKFGTYWVGDPSADWGDSTIFDYEALRESGYLPWQASMVMIERAVPLLTLLAIFITRRKWRTLLPIYALLLYTTLLHAATHAEARLNAPFQPFLWMIIAGAMMPVIVRTRVSLPKWKFLAILSKKVKSLDQSTLIFFSIIIAYCLYAGLFIYRTSFVVNGERYFSLFDDAMISMRYAKNLANGHGLVWNPGGERVEGFTNPLWVLYMALFHLFPIASSKVSVFIQISGAIFLVANLFIVRKIAGFISVESFIASLGAVLLTAFYLPLNNWGLQGMEVSILTLIISISIWKALLCLESGRFPFLPYLLLGVATLVRIDILVPFLALLIFFFISDQKNRSKHLLFGLSVLTFFILSQTLFRIWYFGDPLPNTYYLKMTGYPLLLRISRGLIVFLEFLWQTNLIIFMIALLVLVFRRDRSIFLMIWMFLAQIAYSVYVGGDAWEWWGGANRYLVIVMPIFFVLLAYMLAHVVSLLIKKQMNNQRFVESSLLDRAYRANVNKIRYGVIMVLILICLLNVNSIYGPEALKEWLLIERPMLVLDNKYSVRMALLVKKITNDEATFTVIYGGTPPYFAERHAIDLLGKSDRKIAHEEMRISSWKYTGFYPGHLKWNYDYSIGELKPDVVAQLWNLWGASKEAKPYLDSDYQEVNIDGLTFYLRQESDNIRWNEIPGNLGFTPPNVLLTDNTLVTQEIRYQTGEANEVFLVWGINDWQTPPAATRPAGTILKEGAAHTPMTRTGNTFSAILNVPSGTVIDYGFLITKSPAGTAVQVWDGDGEQDYHTVANNGKTIEIQATPNIVRQVTLSTFDIKLQWQGFLVLLTGVGLIISLGRLHHYRQSQYKSEPNSLMDLQ